MNEAIVGILLIIGAVISPKRRLTEKEISDGLRKKLKRQWGMTISAQADSARMSAAYDTLAKKYRRDFHLLELKHKQEMEKERRKRPPIKMP